MLVLVCLLPTLAAGIYYGFFAADQYEVEMRFNVVPLDKSLRDASSMLDGGGGKSAASAFALNSFVVTQYIASRSMVDQINKEIDIRKMFSTEKADVIERLDPEASIEKLVKYWRKKVDAYFELTNGSVIVTVQAFTPEDALLLSQTILKLSEQAVNELSARARAQVMGFAEAQVTKAGNHLLEEQKELLAFRQKEKVFDPVQDASANTSSVASLRQGLAQMKGEAAALSKYMSEASPNLELLRAKIKASEDQLRSVQASLPATGGSSGGSAATMSTYETLKGQVAIAQTAYQTALASLVSASRSADGETIYLSTFIPPSLPIESTKPKRLKIVFLVFISTFAFWAIGTLIAYSIGDHRT
ncbi:MAG: hypothetical protein Q7J29_05570 [Stagnimonas sp.]|nr:hypothetical protein [Stagnimonas sp.]